MKEKTAEKHNTGRFNYKPRKRNERRSETKNGTIPSQTEKLNDKRQTLQIL